MEKSGHPVPIVVPDPQNKHKFVLNEKDMEKILLQEDIKDRYVVVVSIAGAFRKGKSFMLNFFLRYMEYLCAADGHNPSNTSWLGNEDEDIPLKGFSWRGGMERETTGILMWSEVFRLTLPDDEKVAVILLDTQGAFDTESTVRECATVFALSTMLSSIQVYNVPQDIQEDNLQHLQLFAEYGRLAIERGDAPFQKLQFLVRDWSNPYDANYGPDGGQSVLHKKLTVTSQQHPELQLLRKNIKSSFSNIQCFLMPHPGLKVATNPQFNGKLSDIENDFKTHLEQFVPSLLSPENLITKEINGHKIKVNEWLVHFKCYMLAFNGDDLPEPKTMLEATAEASNLSAVASAKELYSRSMMNTLESSEYLTTEEFENLHRTLKEKAFNQFKEERKLGDVEFCKKFRKILKESIETDYIWFSNYNKTKAEAVNVLAYTSAKEKYYQGMNADICKNTKPYLSTDQFKESDERWKTEALQQFNNRCKDSRDELSGKFRIKLQENITNDREQAWFFNKYKADAHNQSSLVSAKETYLRGMATDLENPESRFNTEELEQKHASHKAKALEQFINESLPGGDEFSERCKIELENDINLDYETLKAINQNKNSSKMLSDVAASRETYQHLMVAKLESETYLTSREFEEAHLQCKTAALEKVSEKYELSELYRIHQLEQFIEGGYNRYKSLNKTKADATYQSTVSAAREIYCRGMAVFLETPQRFLSSSEFDEEHQKCSNVAFEQFARSRKNDSDEFYETHKIKLEQDIEIERHWFKTCNESKANAIRAFLKGQETRKAQIVRDIFSGASFGAVLVGIAAAGPVGAIFGSVWGGILGHGIGGWARK